MDYCSHFVRKGKAVLGAALCLTAALFMPAGLAAADQAKLQVLASIKPLALIAQEVVGSEADVLTLLPITASPHDYPLKMSDHKRLRSADLVLWVGPELESFLARPLATIAQNKIITSYQLAGLNWPASAAHDHHHSDHGHVDKDPHIWLDPHNAVVISRVLAAHLAQLRPESAAIFQANAARFANSMELLGQQLQLQLAPIKDIGFAVYHEGYAHFVARYGLNQVAYVTYTPERRPGAKHLQEFRQALTTGGQCLFVEPHYKAQGIESMAAPLSLRIGTLDPIGDQHVSSYQQLLQQLSAGFLACLTDGADN